MARITVHGIDNITTVPGPPTDDADTWHAAIGISSGDTEVRFMVDEGGFEGVARMLEIAAVPLKVVAGEVAS